MIRKQITTAVKLLDTGKTVAFPTETVYGLGADISIPSAIDQVFKIKGRPTNHPLIVHFSRIAQLQYWAREIPPAAWKLAKHFWPGPLTLILKRSSHVPQNVTGGQDTVGLRIPNHPVALALLNTLGDNRALAAPSANRFGKISPTTAAHVYEELGTSVDMILDGGACEIGLESTIVSFDDQMACVLRPGGIPLTLLNTILNGQVTLATSISLKTRASGTLASHYAPSIPLETCLSESLLQRTLELKSHGLRIAVIKCSASDLPHVTDNKIAQFLMPREPSSYGRQLYATLRQFDNSNFDYILIETPPNKPDWLAIIDRLQRASHIK